MKAVKIIPEFTQMTGLTDEQRTNYKMTQVVYDPLDFSTAVSYIMAISGPFRVDKNGAF